MTIKYIKEAIFKAIAIASLLFVVLGLFVLILNALSVLGAISTGILGRLP